MARDRPRPGIVAAGITGGRWPFRLGPEGTRGGGCLVDGQSLMHWDQYEPYQPGFRGSPANLTRLEAKRAFERLMGARFERIEVLARLLDANGIELNYSDTGIRSLESWFRGNVEGDCESGRLDNLWYAVVNDIGLFMGEAIIKQWPHLQWVLFTHSKRDVCYQRHVIMGFAKAKNPYYYVDTDQPLAQVGSKIVCGLHVDPDWLLKTLEWAGRFA